MITKSTSLRSLCLITTTLGLGSAFAENANVETLTAEVKRSYLEHGAKAQFYRWFQVYERPEGGIENALDLLDEDFHVKSGLGEAKGHDQYRERVQSLPKTWQNAHRVSDIEVSIPEEGEIGLTAKVTYQNKGLLPDNQVREATLSYEAGFAAGETLLRPLGMVVISQEDERVADEFIDTYPVNRVLSLMHYWLGIIEDPKRDAEPFKEILADDFELNFSSGAITTHEGLAEWLAGPGSQVAASQHTVRNFEVTTLDDGTMKADADFDWIGVLPNGALITAKTRHSWEVVNDVEERFARIRKVDVEVLEAPVPLEK